MQREYGDEVSIVGVAGRDEMPAIVAFVDDLDVGGFPHAVDSGGDLWRAYGITNQPSFVFLNDDGTSVGFLGAMGAAGMSEQIEVLLAS